jgi:asparagine synthase (glutamine-hydrolysing)
MASVLAHRGPDGSSSWQAGSIGFASRTLRTSTESRTIPESIHRESGDALVVVADARIDNRPELGDRLRLGRALDELSDAALIGAAYRAWGSDAPLHLIGDFAFAVWDGSRRMLYCARDPFGTRPFCYHVSSRAFLFASEIKALFCLSEVPREVDEVQVGYFLDDFMDDPERTYFRDVHRLPAAHFLEVSSDGVRMRRYWALDPGREVRYPEEGQYSEAFRELLLEAVRARVQDAVPVGAALSGGLDSSSIVGAARRVLPADQPIHAFSAVFPGLPPEERQYNDESPYIDAVAEGAGIVSHRVRADLILPLADYERVVAHFDSPPSGFNLYMHWALLAAAQRQGIRVFLDGTDGDSVVSKGYERFIDLSNEGRWDTAVDEVKALTARHGTPRRWFQDYLVRPQLLRLAQTGRWRNWYRGTRAVAAGFDRPLTRLWWKYGVLAIVPSGMVRRGVRGTEPRKPLMRREFSERMGLADRKRALVSDEWVSSAREDHARVLSLPRYQFALELIDNAAAGFGIVPRFPYFDRRLVEYCVAIPPEQKLNDGWTRLIQRRAMEGILPPVVQWRVDKGMLGFNFVRGMQTEAPMLSPILFDEPSPIEEYIDMQVLRTAQERLVASDPASEQANEDAMTLYKGTVLAMWLRGFGSRRP